MHRFAAFLKNWMLLVSMGAGVSAYLIYAAIPSLHTAGPALHRVVSILQPTLLFLMMFLSFCKVSPKELHPMKWQLYLLAAQIGSALALAGVTLLVPAGSAAARVLPESAMLCLLCPTATAAAVVTGKLGGHVAGTVTYTILINIAVALTAPAIFPLLQADGGIGFIEASSGIIRKVFPMLIFPCLTAWAVRYATPGLHARLLKAKDLAFHLWAFSLSISIAMTCGIIARGHYPAWVLLSIGAVSLICCIAQFQAGRAIGRRFSGTGRTKGGQASDSGRTKGGQASDPGRTKGGQASGPGADEVTAGQAFGQKNTVLAIWMACTFLTPIVSVAGGFYSIWHNLYNSWQLYRSRKENQ